MVKLLKKLSKLLMAPLNMLLKVMMNPMSAGFSVMLLVVVILLVVAYRQSGQENFSKLKRYFYMYNPTDKNSSYDVRGDNLAIKKNQEDVGIFYESSLEQNQRNQRLFKDFDEMNDNMESTMNTTDNQVQK